MSHDAYSALSDVTRRRILEALRGGPRPVGELVTELQVSQPTVSKHLKVLRDAGMVGTRPQGQKRFYSLTAQPLTEVVDWVETLIAAAATGPAEQDPQVEQAQQTEPAAPRPTAAPAAEMDPGAPEGDDDAAGVEDVAHDPEADGSAPETEPVAAQSAESDDDAVTASANEASRAGTTDAAPLRAEPDERALPWFTARVTEITEKDEGDVVEPDCEEAAEDAGTGETARDSAAADEARDAVDAAEAESGEGSPGPEEEVEQGESQITGDTLDSDVHAAPAAQPEAADGAEPRDVAPRTTSPEVFTSENTEQLRPRGGAHRRQSGLLSTLTGLRRRGRGTRRD